MLFIYKLVVKKFFIIKKIFDFICGNEDFFVYGFRWEVLMFIYIKSFNVIVLIL